MRDIDVHSEEYQRMERDNRNYIGGLQLAARPELRACVECGENAPENGLICDECRMEALND